MARGNLILNRYEPIGTAGTGGFGTVQIAWDPRIQRKVAIKTIRLTELDAYRAYLPGAQAVSSSPTADRWHGAIPWNEYLEEDRVEFGGYPAADFGRYPAAELGPDDYDDYGDRDGYGDPLQVTSLSHLPGLDEARTAAMLSDPRIVTVYDFEIRDRTAYLIMEYVEGITLTRLLSDYADFLTLDMVAAVFDAVAGALVVAHKAGVLHLDIKPDNIIINTQGQAKVTDFGLATLADASGAGTTGGGTIGYMPPEQMRREHLDARTDEWSLAVVSYEMLTGDNPFCVGSLDQAEAAIENAELVLPSLCWENLDEQIDDVVFYALDPDREERYATVAHFAEEMDKFLGDADAGRAQLQMVVSDALGLNNADDGDSDEADEWDGEDEPGQRSPGFFSRLFGWAGASRGRERGGDSYDEYEDEYAPAYDEPAPAREVREPARQRAPRPPREPFAQRFGGGRLSFVASRAFAAAGSGFVTWLALANLPFIPTAFGAGSVFMIAVAVAVVAAVGAIVPHVGALVSLVLLGLAIAICGHPIIGLVLAVVAVVWWVLVARESVAGPNVALSLPLFGAVGGGSAVPFLSGAFASLPVALVTTVLVVVEAFVFASFGSGTLLGWDAFAHWDFSRVDLTKNMLAMMGRVSTWTTAAGWLAATAVLALARMRDSKWLAIAGLAVAVALLLVGSLVFASPTPQLFVPVALAAAVLIVTF